MLWHGNCFTVGVFILRRFIVSTYKKSSNAARKLEEEHLPLTGEGQLAEIIPFPDVQKIAARMPREKRRVRLEGKYLYYQDKKIPILQFQKAGHERLLKLLVKEIG
jgi:hypothetical protein